MSYEQEIAKLRNRIDGIDEKMTALFEQRMDAVKEVAALKQQHDKPVMDAGREQAVIDKALGRLKNKGYEAETASFYRALIDISKKSEQKHMAAPEPSPLPEGARVGYLGIPGSYSHTAAEEAFAGAELVSFNTFESIFEGLKNDAVSLAIVPAENTETGSITAVVDLLARYGFYIVAEKLLRVSHSLLGVKGAKPDDIRIIYSHPEPFGQCSSFLSARPLIETRPALSTAQAADMVARAGDSAAACIASSRAAEIYGLDIIEDGIQNSGSNCTRFVVIAKRPVTGMGCNKTSIVFMVEHRPGSLFEILKLFSDGGVNILKLESRPLRDRPFEYMFHLDFEGSLSDENVAATIERVKNTAADYIFLGCYRREAAL